MTHSQRIVVFKTRKRERKESFPSLFLIQQQNEAKFKLVFIFRKAKKKENYEYINFEK